MTLALALALLLALAGTLHSGYNLRILRRIPRGTTTDEVVSVLVPARNEETRLPALLASLSRQTGVARMEILVLDDDSSDATAQVIADASQRNSRIRAVDDTRPLPAGWLGKTWACHRLAEAATGTVLVFCDADVVLADDAIAGAVNELRREDLALLSPYPRQIAVSWLERLVQPLLQWSWLTTLPVRRAERSARPSLAAANGQFLVVDALTYRRAGGYDAVKDQVLDDIALLRAVKAAGGRGGVADGTPVATCRMYESPADLIEGYSKSLWSAFGSATGGAVVSAGMAFVYVFPVIAILWPGATLAQRLMAAGAWLSAVLGRMAIAHRTQARIWPDTLAHPLSIALFIWLVARSWIKHERGTLTWKGRTL